MIPDTKLYLPLVLLSQRCRSRTEHGYGPAVRDTWAAVGAVASVNGIDTDFAKMAGWLREEGFMNVKDEHVNLKFGAVADDAEWGARAANVLVGVFAAVVGAWKKMKVDVPQVDLEKLPERAREEMIKQGGNYPLVFTFGQKPAARRRGV
ncbi:hypothetical protein F4810DRAFT_289317 [Camillea tinctor]|nr:hypothetical protein F4810DRAFT_289317 [Camillea tinctor]